MDEATRVLGASGATVVATRRGPSTRVRRLLLAATVLALLVVAALVADRVVRQRTEDALAADLQAQIPGLTSEPDVTISGFPFLTQVMAGELDDVHLTAPDVTLEGLALEDVDVRLRGVSTDLPTRAREATMTASVDLAAVQPLVQEQADVELEIVEGSLVASGRVLGLPLSLGLEPQAAGRAIAVEVVTLSISGFQVDVGDLPAGLGDDLRSIAVPVESLPEGLELTDVTVTDAGFDLRAAGADVVFDQPVG